MAARRDDFAFNSACNSLTPIIEFVRRRVCISRQERPSIKGQTTLKLAQFREAQELSCITHKDTWVGHNGICFSA
jgi:hypothetical protein